MKSEKTKKKKNKKRKREHTNDLCSLFKFYQQFFMILSFHNFLIIAAIQGLLYFSKVNERKKKRKKNTFVKLHTQTIDK